MNMQFGNNGPMGGNSSLNIIRDNQRQMDQVRRMQEEQRHRMVRDVHRPHMG